MVYCAIQSVDHRRVSMRVIVMVCLFFVCGLPANAIVMRHDTGYGSYLARESDYPAVFPLLQQNRRKTCIATLVAAQWAITAAHCVEQAGLPVSWRAGDVFPVQIAGQPHAVVSVIYHPAWPGQASEMREAAEVDLALLKLQTTVDHVSPMPLYAGHDEQGQVMTFVGWGYSGIGSTAEQFNDGRLRFARNTVIAASSQLRFQFDDPHAEQSLAVPFEGIPGLGDSGGPAILRRDAEEYLAGVAIGEVEQGRGLGLYGATVIYERISLHHDWIQEVVAIH